MPQVFVTEATHQRLTKVKYAGGWASFEVVIGKGLDLLEQAGTPEYVVNAKPVDVPGETPESPQNAPASP